VPFHVSDLVAIVDTNVLHDILSAVDVLRNINKPEPEALYRLSRAGFGLRLAIYFDAIGAVTLSAGDELMRLATQLVPPTDATEEAAYLHMWVTLIKPKVLRRWRIASASIEGTGTRIDDELIALAKRFGRPLITNEGVGHEGPTGNKRSIRAKCAALGVEVLTQEEFCIRHPLSLSNTKAKRFVNEVQRLGPSYMNGHPAYAAAQHHVGGAFVYFQNLLFGTEPEAVAERAERQAKQKVIA
jgi:hypothetical protein